MPETYQVWHSGVCQGSQANGTHKAESILQSVLFDGKTGPTSLYHVRCDAVMLLWNIRQKIGELLSKFTLRDRSRSCYLVSTCTGRTGCIGTSWSTSRLWCINDFYLSVEILWQHILISFDRNNIWYLLVLQPDNPYFASLADKTTKVLF